eukprot:superscaffoldBa00000390_g4327
MVSWQSSPKCQPGVTNPCRPLGPRRPGSVGSCPGSDGEPGTCHGYGQGCLAVIHTQRIMAFECVRKCAGVHTVELWTAVMRVSPEPGGNASHTLICHYRETAVQPAESERVGNKAGSVCVTRDGWLVSRTENSKGGFVTEGEDYSTACAPGEWQLLMSSPLSDLAP